LSHCISSTKSVVDTPRLLKRQTLDCLPPMIFLFLSEGEQEKYVCRTDVRIKNHVSQHTCGFAGVPIASRTIYNKLRTGISTDLL